jgi:glutaredoxin
MLDIKDAVRNNKSILMFSRDKCVYCIKLEKELDAMSLPYQKHAMDMSDTCSIEELKLATGMKTFPMLFIGDEKIGGYTEFRSLRIVGTLEEKLYKIGIKLDSQF